MDVKSFVWPTRVRGYECDAQGHVNNAIYLYYLQQATAEAWGALAPVVWELRKLAMEYLAPAVAGDDLEVIAWPDGQQDGLAACGYAVRRATDTQMLLRARAVWAWVSVLPGRPAHGTRARVAHRPGDRETREPQPPVADWPAAMPPDISSVNLLRLPADLLNGRRFRWTQTVRINEVDGSGRVNPVEVLRWIEEAKFVACQEVGWPVERWVAADLVIVQIRHDSEFFDTLRAGDRIEVVSHVCDLRRVKGTWRHEVYRNGELVALDYSTGAFLNRALRPSPPPQAMMDALIKGV